MYLLKTRQVTHVLALSVAFSMIFALYCYNFIDESLSNIIYNIQITFTPQSNTYGNFYTPYYD